MLDLINAIYDAVTDTGSWQLVLDSIVQGVRARQGILSLLSGDGESHNIFRISGWTPDDIALYSARYAAGDLWRIGAARRAEWSVSIDSELCSRDELEASETYREFYQPRGAAHGMGATIITGPAGQSLVTMTRSLDDGPFGESELALLRSLIPHLTRAARLHSEFGSLRAQLGVFIAHLDRLPYPFLLSDTDRRVLYANAGACSLSAARDGAAIQSGRLTIGASDQDHRLQETFTELALRAKSDLTRMEIKRASGKQPLRLVIMRAADGALPWGTLTPSIAVQVIDPDLHQCPNAAALGSLFCLTPTEARVAASLTLGRSVEEIAAETFTSIGTVRTHLKRILFKTGTSRQAELISLILRTASFSR